MLQVKNFNQLKGGGENSSNDNEDFTSCTSYLFYPYLAFDYFKVRIGSFKLGLCKLWYWF